MGEGAETEKLYDVFRDKYALPDLKTLDKEFSMGEIDPTPFVLRSILYKMDDRCDHILKILTDLVQPESHLVDMHEAENLREDDKKIVNDLFKKIAYYRKEFLIRELDYDEAHAAGLISRFYAEWLSFKPDLLRILARLRDTWAEEPKLSQEFGYFG